MDYFLTEEQMFMKDVAKDLAEKKIKPVSAHYDEANEFPWPVVEDMAAADIFRVFIPEDYGGMGGDTPIMNMCVVTEELSKVDGGISLAFAATGLGTFPILISGNEEQKQSWLPRIADGNHRGVRSDRSQRRLGRRGDADPGDRRWRLTTSSTAPSSGSPTPARPISTPCSP